ncbi:hypothetical protein BRARA_B00540 [Brassica rapa]|uniref:Uncharacterized protein n=3 Tax=Brassica campestris TaxID=3711 RepID=A0A398A6C2_BRACM|nr:hypothetical protein IGI04_004765 [Brassica rapa subsp. trilocularis]RID73387.1 hypothetical protein BRARA_B00540 [Brassica rapa]
MGMSKSIKVIVSLAFVVFLAFAATKIEAARTIDYAALDKDHALACDKLNPKTCKKQEMSHYSKGCEQSEHCRT